MRRFDEQGIRDLATGAAILASGGGGDPNIGTLAALEATNLHHAPTLMALDELAADALVDAPWLLGSPLPLIEKFPVGEELVDSLRALERHLGREVDAILPAEVGGVNSLVPLALAARTGLPVVDADCMGRAFPALDQLTLTLDGVSATPMSIVDEHSNVAILDCRDTGTAERLARAMTVAFGAIASVTSFPTSGEQARRSAIAGTLTLAREIGAAIREAPAKGEQPLEALYRLGGAVHLFRGRIDHVERRTTAGWAIGETRIDGMGEDAGATMTVRFQNENLIALRGNEVVATAPDVITLVDPISAKAITSEHLRYGARVAVLGLPSDPRWRTPEGLALGGPERFGYDVDFVPVEGR